MPKKNVHEKASECSMLLSALKIAPTVALPFKDQPDIALPQPAISNHSLAIPIRHYLSIQIMHHDMPFML